MSLTQLFSLVDAMQAPRSLAYDFGLGVHPHQLQTIPTQQNLLNPYQCMDPRCPTSPLGKIMAQRRSREANKMANGDTNGWRYASTHVGKDGFQVCMDVTQFKPSELSVKVKDNYIVVEGKHGEQEDDQGYISRHFVRRYAVPRGYEADKVMSSLSSDGVLTLSVPKPQAVDDMSTQRVVQIQQVGPAYLNVKQITEETKETKENFTNGH